MTNINWDLAPEGAVAVGQRFGELAFINTEGLAYIGGDWVDSSGWNIIGKRPQLERKTVEDAVDYIHGHCEGVWACNLDALCHVDDAWFYDKSDANKYQVCTREEFEACVAAKAAQSEWKELSVYGKPKSTGDKSEWTHTWNGNKCRVVFTEDYRSWIKGDALDTLVPTDSLKPIKPTITKAEAEKRLGATITG